MSIDFLQTDGRNYLIIVDRHSGFITVFPMSSTKSEASIEVLTDHFLHGGYPRRMRADGAPNLDSKALESFRTEHGIAQELSSAYFAESKGLVESACQIVQDLIHKSKEERTGLMRMLSYFNNTLRRSGYTPVELYWGEEVRNPALPRLPGCLDLRKK